MSMLRSVTLSRYAIRGLLERPRRIGLFIGTSILAGSAVFNQRRLFSTVHAEEGKTVLETVTSPLNTNVDTSHSDPDDERYILKENKLKSVLSGKKKEDFDITLYQYQVCPFCCKVRAFLDYNNIPYKIVEVDPLFKSEIKFSNYTKVPVVVVSGEVVVDSSVIISSLSEIIKGEDKQSPDEFKWRKWVDQKFVHTIPPNIYRTLGEAREAFEYISNKNNFTWFQKFSGKQAGSVAMWAVSKKLAKRHNITNEREAIYQCGYEWYDQIKDKQFHGGDKPDLADLAVYGVLSSVEGLQTFHDLFENVELGPWYDRTRKAVGNTSGVSK
ncbi:prostaglandin E synthase [Acrasis kona]|uniref:Prostaglandin E synthase 2 n=1 Tax=Acrasis kona TaxID=1008807 RepID=A0AAW2YNL7_9EUKA